SNLIQAIRAIGRVGGEPTYRRTTENSSDLDHLDRRIVLIRIGLSISLDVFHPPTRVEAIRLGDHFRKLSLQRPTGVEVVAGGQSYEDSGQHEQPAKPTAPTWSRCR